MIGQITLSILEQFKRKKNPQTARQVAFALELNPNSVNAKCQYFAKHNILARERSSSYGKLDPWKYKLTPKGLQLLSFKRKLKALLHEQE